MIDLHSLNHHRQVGQELNIYGQIGDESNGVFAFTSPTNPPAVLRVVASSGNGWEHVSVSPNKQRCPTWEEMEHIKRLFFKPSEAAMQLHVATADHISFHPHTLHIWRPTDREIPLPPGWMVGPDAAR